MRRLLRQTLILGGCLALTWKASSQRPALGSSPLAHRLGAVTVQVDGQPAVDRPSLPYLRLGQEQGLQVTFDLLDQPASNLNYRLRQMNADWKASEEPTVFYLSGFATGHIEAPRPSAGTIHRYDHYELSLPELARTIKQSGNYQLEIYAGEDPERPILLIPFLVVEELGVSIQGAVDEVHRGAILPGLQEVDLRISLPAERLLTPRELRVLVLQNARWDNAVTLTSPSYASLSELRYEDDRTARFEGGNTYLKVEHLTDKLQGLGAEACLQTDSGTLIRVLPLREPGAKLLRTDPAHQGIQRLRSLDTEEVATEGEYHWVNFQLMMPRLTAGTVILAGDAFRYLPESMRELTYDPQAGAYTQTLLLKSGYQEYQYLLREAFSASLRSEPFVGSHYPTKNSYTALVYLRGVVDRHDRLIGYQPL